MNSEVMSDVSIREMWESSGASQNITYEAFRQRFHRLNNGGMSAKMFLKSLGIEEKKPKKAPRAQFLAYDGEGWDDKYVLLANSFGEYIVNEDGLTSKECLDFLITRYEENTKRVWFSFGYDVNHMLKDVPDDLLLQLIGGRIVKWEGFRLQYIPGKMFIVNNVRFFDVFGFFQTSFVRTVEQMLGSDAVTDVLREGKAARGSFETWNMEALIAYNADELELLVKVMDRLKEAFIGAGINITEWYGPGAVAKYWYRQYNVKPQEQLTPDVLHALNRSYYGGRFEQPVLGHVEDVYEYDIHSAYPSVMADMPHFKKWHRFRKYKPERYSIWHISFDFREDIRRENSYDGRMRHGFMPLPVRTKEGRICFPVVGKGWYWQSEIANAIEFFPNAKITFHEGYIAEVEGKPFAWVKDKYDERARLKAEGNLAEYGIKVGLNSLYGKTAQRVGSNRYFSLAWAGYITSSTRAKLARAGYTNGREHVLGFATDAIFSSRPLSGLDVSDALGTWEESRFKNATFFQSGVYRLTHRDDCNCKDCRKPHSGEVITDRYRGSPLRNGIDDIIDQLQRNPGDFPEVKIGRFITHLLAIRGHKAYGSVRLQFVKVKFELKIDAPYKRHYTGFITGYDDEEGVLHKDFSRMLRMPIRSYPKIWMEDDSPYGFEEHLYKNRTFQNIESYPPPMRDNILQSIVDEGDRIAMDVTEQIDDLASLPVVEVEGEVM